MFIWREIPNLSPGQPSQLVAAASFFCSVGGGENRSLKAVAKVTFTIRVVVPIVQLLSFYPGWLLESRETTK